MVTRGFAALVFCLPLAAVADDHRQAVLQLVSIGATLREEARAVQHKGMLGIDVQSRMAAPECAEFFQDVVSMRNLQALGARGGALALRWHGKRELVLRVQREPALALEVHDSSGPRPACSVRSVAAGDWKGKLTPLLLDFPGMTKKPQVFPVDPLRSPNRETLK